MRVMITIGVAAACIGLIVGCGGNEQTDEEAIKESIATYFDGYAQGDGDMACSRMTEPVAQSVTELDPDGLTNGLGGPLDTSSCESMIEGLSELYAPSAVVTSVEVDGDLATAYLDEGREVEMIKEDGEWLMNSGFAGG